jgi:hypothetical protein
MFDTYLKCFSMFIDQLFKCGPKYSSPLVYACYIILWNYTYYKHDVTKLHKFKNSNHINATKLKHTMIKNVLKITKCCNINLWNYNLL